LDRCEIWSLALRDEHGLRVTTLSLWLATSCGIRPAVGGRMFLRIAGIYLRDHKASQPRRTSARRCWATRCYGEYLALKEWEVKVAGENCMCEATLMSLLFTKLFQWRYGTWTESTKCTSKMKKEYKIPVIKGRSPHKRQKRRWGDNIKMHLAEFKVWRCGPDKSGSRKGPVANSCLHGTNLRVPYSAGNVLGSLTAVHHSREGLKPLN
jgi:hypothetical protein